MYFKAVSLVLFQSICWTIQADICPPPPQVIWIGGDPYLMTNFEHKNKQKNPPQSLLINDNDILYKTVNQSFSLNIEKKREKELKFRVPIKKRIEYVYPGGGDVTIREGKIVYTWKERNLKIKLNLNKKYVASSLVADLEDNRIVFLAFPPVAAVKYVGKLFFFERTKIDLIGQVANLKEVEGLGYNVTAVAIDRQNGNLVVSVEDDDKHWHLQMLEKLDKPTKKRDLKSAHDRKALLSAIDRAADQIVQLFEEATMGADTKIAKNEVKEVMQCDGMLKKTEESVMVLQDDMKTVKSSVVNMKNVLKEIESTSPELDAILQKSASIFKDIEKIGEPEPERCTYGENVIEPRFGYV